VVPDAFGRVEPVVVRTDRGGEILVLLHTNPGALGYASLALEVEAAGGSLLSRAGLEADYARWARFKSSLASRGSLVRAVQQVERVQPVSLAAHQAWLTRAVPAGVQDLLTAPYADLLARVEWSAEAHRSLLVLRMPFTLEWDRRVRDELGAQDSAARARMAVAEAQRVASATLAEGGLRICRPLSERQFAAAVRAAQNPDYSWDDVRDVDLTTCWRPYAATATAVTFDGTWACRTATVRAAGLPSERVPVDVLRDLVVGIYPAVVRTLSVTEELIPAGRARHGARSAVTVDAAGHRADAATVSDGSAATQLTASQQRLYDLRPGSGHHGDNFALYLLVAGRGHSGLTRAMHRVEAVAADLSLELTWLDYAQDTSWTATLPLARGLRMTTKKVHL
jgi:hypothetical protein